MSAPDMSYPDLFLDCTAMNSPASMAETKLLDEIPRTPALSTGLVDMVFRDPLDGSAW